MPARITIAGTAEFRETASRLKAAGQGKVVREMAKKMRTAAKPAVEDAKRSVKSLASKASRGGGRQARRTHTLSRRRKITERAKRSAAEGRGLRDSTARALHTRVDTRGNAASVRIRTRSEVLPPDQRELPYWMNAGQWRHPLFGDRGIWVAQTVSPPEWFDRPMRRHGAKVRTAAFAVIDRINDDIVG